jgi:polyphosphate:AMP phosphotransferase
MRVYGKATDHDLDAAMVRINAFEKTLVENGTLLIKLWLHISKATQKKTFKKLEKNPQTKFRVTKRDWKHAKLYDTFRPVCERAIRETSTGEAPWLVVESGDRRYRRVTVAQHLVERIQRRIDAPPKPTPVPPSPIDDPETILDTLDLKASIDRADYSDAIEKQQARLAKLARKARAGNIGVMLVFEGVDAAGKGGAIRRIIEPLDARQYRVIRIAAPTDEEKARHYLWRFWRHLPRLGRFTIYDRSWYGRVLVERIEGFAGEAEWMRAYKEINDFEEQLVEFGIVLVKFWLHISRDEQLTRFQLREKTPWKQYKITEEDYRNREKANLYELCANDMVSRTSTEYALWTLIPSEDKRYARVKVLETVCERLEGALAR